jgi:hypothetical protein
MSDEPRKVGRKILRRVAIGAVLLGVFLILAFLAYVPIRSIRMMREFDNLWNTTDAIQRRGERGGQRAEGNAKDGRGKTIDCR